MYKDNLFTLLVLFSAYEVKSWTNYRFTFLASKIHYDDLGVVNFHKFNTMKKNRTYSYLSLNFTIIKPVDNFVVSGQLYNYVSNRYKEFLTKLTADACEVISPAGASKGSGMSAVFYTQLKTPLHKIWTGPGQKFPDSCPLTGNYHANIHFDEDIFPSYFLPAGRWKFDLDFFTNGKVALNLTFEFEIVNFVSELQRRRG